MAIDMRPIQRVQELDALRGLAALAVVLYHYTSRYDRIYGYPGGSPMEFHLGKFGVELFFMISGFVIFMSLKKVRAGLPGLLDFAISRFSRLYPVFWAALSVTFLAVMAFGLPGREVETSDLPANATMLPGILGFPMVDGVYWTLEKELFFYFWMAFILLTGSLKNIRVILLGWLLVSVLALPIAQVLGSEASLIYKIIKNVFILDWIPFFGFGILAYLRFSEGATTKFDIALVGLILLRMSHNRTLEDSLIILCLVFVFYLMAKGWLSWLACRPLLFLGTISYSLYLIHQNIGYIVIRETLPIFHTPWLPWGLAIATSIVMATLITFTIERPAMALIRRLKQTRPAPIAAKPA